MGKALVVFESLWGNTEKVARAVAEGLSSPALQVDVCEVSDAPAAPSPNVDLVVVGGPTHAFSMTRASTREDARNKGADHGGAMGLREWLDALPDGEHAQRVATFDTRVEKMRHLPGSAAKSAARASGADRMFALGGVQALAAMAFGLLDGVSSDMIVGAGNAYVAEAKRQLYGKVGIDVLAGPSEVAVIADETATAQMVAADLLAQAEHGPSSPACLVTTSAELAAAVEVEIDRQLEGLATREIAGAAWRDWGSIYVADSPKTAIEIMDLLAPEHLEILTADPDFYLDNLRNYGSLFLGEWSTVAYADKGMSGTNHVLPTARGARYTGGLSVTGYLKQLTYQRATREATQIQAGPVVTISDFEEMPGHRDSAQLRLDLIADS